MEFSFDKFYRLNRRIFIWGLLFLLIWLLRDFFGLIFLTFVLSFISQPLVHFGQHRLRLPRRFAIILVYLLFLLTIGSVIVLITPRVGREAVQMSGNLPQLESKLLELKSDVVARYPRLEEAIPAYLASGLSEGGPDSPVDKDYRKEYNTRRDYMRDSLGLSDGDVLMRDIIPTTDTAKRALIVQYDKRRDELLIETFMTQELDLLRGRMPGTMAAVYRGSITLLLALLFSFLISLDTGRLGKEVRSLSNSRLRDFYNQTAQPVVRFAYVVGQAIRAQALIAVANTLLTLTGLYFLGIPAVVMLTFIVFFCSFIPVLGVFLSTTPMLLVALNSGGFSAALWIVAMVIGIHLIEAYLLNPLIYGQHFKINPVLVLMILFIGHHAFGVWGMILGVPVTYYFIHDVLGVPVWGEKRLPGIERLTKDEPADRPLGAMPRVPADKTGTQGDAARASDLEDHGI